MSDSLERRVECPRHHWLFEITATGIAIKCRAGECRVVYVIAWEEIEARRLEIVRAMVESAYAVTPAMLGELHNHHP